MRLATLAAQCLSARFVRRAMASDLIAAHGSRGMFKGSRQGARRIAQSGPSPGSVPGQCCDRNRDERSVCRGWIVGAGSTHQQNARRGRSRAGLMLKPND